MKSNRYGLSRVTVANGSQLSAKLAVRPLSCPAPSIRRGGVGPPSGKVLRRNDPVKFEPPARVIEENARIRHAQAVNQRRTGPSPRPGWQNLPVGMPVLPSRQMQRRPLHNNGAQTKIRAAASYVSSRCPISAVWPGGIQGGLPMTTPSAVILGCRDRMCRLEGPVHPDLAL